MKQNPDGIIGDKGPYASREFYYLFLDKRRDIYQTQNNDDFPSGDDRVALVDKLLSECYKSKIE